MPCEKRCVRGERRIDHHTHHGLIARKRQRTSAQTPVGRRHRASRSVTLRVQKAKLSTRLDEIVAVDRRERETDLFATASNGRIRAAERLIEAP